METQSQAENPHAFSSDLTSLADPHWQAHAYAQTGRATDTEGSADRPWKRQAVDHPSEEPRKAQESCCTQSPSQHGHQPGKATESQCCTHPEVVQQWHQQPSHEQGSSLQSSSTAEACKAGSRQQGGSRMAGDRAQEEQKHRDASQSHGVSRTQGTERGIQPPSEAGLEGSQGQGKPLLVMEDDGGYVVPVMMTDREIRMPAGPSAKNSRLRAEAEAQATRPRRSRAAALACQATIAEMVKDEEEDAMRSAAVSGREAPKSDAFAASFTSEEDDDVPARSKGRRRWRPEPARQRAGAPGRQSHPPSTTASPVKVQIPELWSMEAEADTPGMSVVGPLHGSRNRLTPSAAPCPSAAWALQGYAGTSQDVGLGQLASWLRETARSGGMVSAPFCFGLQDVATKDWQSAAVEKRYRSCFARVRQVTHETPSDLLDDTGQSRRSTRVRSQPDVFAPSSYSDDELATSQPVKVLTAEDTDMLLGEDYQAALPQQRERPSAPTPSEQHWLQHKVLNIGELGTGILVPQKTTATSGHLQWRIGGKVLSSRKAQQLGLPSGRNHWQEADINCFASCLSRCGKDFGFIAQQLQPPKSRGEVVTFYYDMWKTRRLPRARQWYNSMKEVQEEGPADKAVLDANARHRASVVKAEQRRQIKNGLMWLRETVRQPLDINTNRVKVLERLHRLRQILLAKASRGRGDA